MERLIIEVPDQKSSLVKQLLTELGIHFEKNDAQPISDRKKKLANISVWTEEDLKVFEESKKGFQDWKVDEW